MNLSQATLIGIAVSGWSQAQRQAVIMVLTGAAFETEQFVPHPWNRHAKAKAALRELEKAGHLVRDGGRFLVIESSFATAIPSAPAQLRLLEEPGLGTALADVGRSYESVCPVLDGTLCPSQDGRAVLSETGRAGPATESGSYALSEFGQHRSSKSMEIKIDRFDDRGRPRSDSAEMHREHILERLAKTPNLGALRGELIRRKTPTAHRFWQLFDQNASRAAELIEAVREKRKPAAYLNSALQREVTSS